MYRGNRGLTPATTPHHYSSHTYATGFLMMSTSNHAITASGFIAQAGACVAVAKKSKKQPLI